MTRVPSWAFGMGLLIVAVNGGRSDEPRAVIDKHFKVMLGGERVPPAAMLVRFTIKEGEEPASQGEILFQSVTTRRIIVKHIEGEMVSEEGLVVDGKKAWDLFDGTWEKLEKGDLEAAVRFESLLGSPVMSSTLARTNVTLTALKDAKVDGKPALGVKAAFKGPQATASLFFDKETGLLVKSTLKEKGGVATTVVLTGHCDLGTVADVKLLRAADLESTPEALLTYLKKRAPNPDQLKRVEALIRKLGDDDFDAREKAEKDLVAMGALATGVLERAARDRDAEIARRARACLKLIVRQNEAETFRAVLRQVVWRHPDGSVAELLAVVPGAKKEELQDIKAALAALAEKDGKTDPLLVKALDDPHPTVRAVVAAALGKDDGVYLKEPGRRLFLRGGKMPTKIKVTEEKEVVAEIEILDIQFFNSFDPKLFTKPR